MLHLSSPCLFKHHIPRLSRGKDAPRVHNLRQLPRHITPLDAPRLKHIIPAVGSAVGGPLCGALGDFDKDFYKVEDVDLWVVLAWRWKGFGESEMYVRC